MSDLRPWVIEQYDGGLEGRQERLHFLRARPAQENVLLGLWHTQSQSERLPALRWLHIKRDAALGGVVAFAPRQAATFSRMSASCAQAACHWLRDHGLYPREIHAPAELQSSIAPVFTRLRVDSKMCLMLVDELDALLEPAKPVPGRAIQAGPGHQDVVVDWTCAFGREVFGRPPSGGDQMARDWIGAKRVWLWVQAEHEPVSMAVCNRDVGDHGGNIGYVFTDPRHRKRGYGGAVTHALARHILERGPGSFACLFAMLDGGPSARAVYERIGFSRDSDFVHFCNLQETGDR